MFGYCIEVSKDVGRNLEGVLTSVLLFPKRILFNK